MDLCTVLFVLLNKSEVQDQNAPEIYTIFKSEGGACSTHVENNKHGEKFVNLKRIGSFRRDETVLYV
jgi:hypothetical protein